MNKCPFCGNEIEEGSKFCGSCGNPLTDIGQAEAPVEPVETPAESVEVLAEPIEAPVEPADIPAAPTEMPIEPVNAPAPPVQAPVYSAPQQPVPAYNAQGQYGAMPQPVVKKNKKGMVLAIIVGVMVVLGLIAAALTLFKSGGFNHSLDGEYKLTALAMGGQDYSSYLSYLEDDYILKVDGSECVLEVPGYTTEAKIDQTNHTISAGSIGTVDFTVEGTDIILNLNDEYTMTFTRQ